MRAAYDDRDAAVARLRDAAGLAAEQGSVALLGRCRADLVAFGVPPLPDIPRPRANAAQTLPS